MAKARLELSRELTTRLSADPVLADFLDPIPNLLGRQRRIDDTAIGRIAERLAGYGKAADVRITIDDGTSTKTWAIALTGSGSRVGEAGKGPADLELITTADVIAELASGETSPFAAFAAGRMRVRGDLTVARRIARRLRGV